MPINILVKYLQRELIGVAVLKRVNEEAANAFRHRPRRAALFTVVSAITMASMTSRAAVTAPLQASAAGVTSRVLGHPSDAPFDTVVVLMMENRSFDHAPGWLCAANGRRQGLRYTDTKGIEHETWPLAFFFAADPARGFGPSGQRPSSALNCGL
jgi:hypothetical protein